MCTQGWLAMAVRVTRDGKLVRPGIGHERFLTHPEVSWVVCAECMMYHNTTWPTDDGPMPPLHVGCNCTRTPEVDLSFFDYPFWTQDAEFAKPSKPYEHLRKTIKGRSVYELKRMFGGKTIARLLKAGVIKPEQAVTKTSGIKPLKEVVHDVPGLAMATVRKATLAELKRAVAKASRRLARRKRDGDERK